MPTCRAPSEHSSPPGEDTQIRLHMIHFRAAKLKSDVCLQSAVFLAAEPLEPAAPTAPLDNSAPDVASAPAPASAPVADSLPAVEGVLQRRQGRDVLPAWAPVQDPLQTERRSATASKTEMPAVTPPASGYRLMDPELPPPRFTASTPRPRRAAMALPEALAFVKARACCAQPCCSAAQ